MLPNKTKVTKFFSTLKVPKTVKQNRGFIGFFQYFRSFIPKLGETLLPFHHFSRKESDLVLSDEHHKCIARFRNYLEQACHMKLPMRDFYQS